MRLGGAFIAALNPGRDWAQYALEFKTAPDVDSLTIELSDLGGNKSQTWFDDLELVEISNPAN